MDTQNPRAGQGARAGMSIAADPFSPTRNRPILQANQVMRARLAMLRWAGKLEVRR